jgi:copper chaperone CopZ
MMINSKKTGLFILLVIFALTASTSLTYTQEAASSSESTSNTYVKIFVDGLSCPFCAYGLEKNLKKVDGASDVFISVANGYTTFKVPRENPPSQSVLSGIVEDAGFTAREITFSETPFAKEKEEE